MSQETIEKEVKQEIPDHNKILNDVIEKVSSNNFKIYYYCPPMNVASGGVSVIFKQVNILKNSGFNSCIVYEPRIDNKSSYEESQKARKQINVFEKFNTSWLGKEAENVELHILGEGEVKFNDGTSVQAKQLVINPEDFVIIPEGFPNVMEKFSQIACKKIVLAFKM